jgi:hypothetical protein
MFSIPRPDDEQHHMHQRTVTGELDDDGALDMMEMVLQSYRQLGILTVEEDYERSDLLKRQVRSLAERAQTP